MRSILVRQGAIARTVLALVITAVPVSLAFPEVASAAEGDETSDTRRVLVGKLAGAKPTSARAWIVEGLENNPDYSVVDEKESLKLPTGSTKNKIAEYAQENEADVVILGKSQFSQKKGWSAELTIYDGLDGSEVEKVEVDGGSFKEYEESLVSGEAFAAALAKAKGQPRPEPEPEPEPDPEPEVDLEEQQPEEEPAAEPREDDGATGGPSPLNAQLGVRLYGRSFRYTDPLSEVLPGFGFEEPITYNLDAAPMPFVRGEWYPAAHWTNKWPAHLGVAGGYEIGVATSVVFRGERLEQSHDLMFVGGRGRIPVGPVEFLATADYVKHTFTVSGDEQAPADGMPISPDNPGTPVFPDVSYDLVELGAQFRWRTEHLMFGAHGSYNIVLGMGELGSEEWYPNASAQAVDFGVFGGVTLSRLLELQAGLDMRAYGFAFNPDPDSVTDESRVAGGATDRYMSVWLALGVTWPGSEGAATAGEPAEGAGSAGESGGDEGDDFDSFD